MFKKYSKYCIQNTQNIQNTYWILLKKVIKKCSKKLFWILPKSAKMYTCIKQTKINIQIFHNYVVYLLLSTCIPL